MFVDIIKVFVVC